MGRPQRSSYCNIFRTTGRRTVSCSLYIRQHRLQMRLMQAVSRRFQRNRRILLWHPQELPLQSLRMRRLLPGPLLQLYWPCLLIRLQWPPLNWPRSWLLRRSGPLGWPFGPPLRLLLPHRLPASVTMKLVQIQVHHP